MGKRKATRMAILRAGDAKGMQMEINSLNQVVENLQILLNQETEKSAVLKEKIQSLENQKTVKKVSKKKATSKKEDIVTETTEIED